MDDQIEKNAERSAGEAEKEAERVRAAPDRGSYTHVFKKPFTYEGVSYDMLTFQFDAMTGGDSLEIVKELRLMGITVVSKPYMDEYVEAFAARSCTWRDGNRRLRAAAFRTMGYEDYAAICGRTKNFLLRAEL